jgi:site-specific DNA-methyltransferase (adenine-specific)
MRQLKIEYLETDKLIPYINNPRINDNAVDAVAGSIAEFGFKNPIIVDRNNVIIAGHTRLLAARKLGLDQVPVIRAEDLTEKQVKAFRIADNKTAELSEWDDELLAMELEGLEDMFTGFSDGEIDALLNQDGPAGVIEDDFDEEPPKNPISKRGDIWQLGRHRLMCGDSTAITDVDRLMDGKIANICFTSPPYNVGELNVKGNNTTKKKYNTYADNKTESEYFDFIVSNLDAIIPHVEEIFYNIGLVENNKRVIIDVLYHYKEQFKDIIYWKKSTCAPHIQQGVVNNLVEFILCFGDGKRKFKNATFRQGSYWNVIEGPNASGNEYSDIHKATFPIYLPTNIIQNFTATNGIVMDCFGGTGTTLIACEQTNRICYMMELDEKYCDVIVKRWEQFTGQKAVLL